MNGVVRKGRHVSIDVLKVRREAAAGTLSEEDRKTAERIIPGILGPLPVRIAGMAFDVNHPVTYVERKSCD